MILNSLDFYQSRRYLYHPLFIILIFTSFTVAISLQYTTDRSIIFRNFVEHQQQRDKSSRFVTCVMRFIKEYFGDPNRILLLLPDLLREIPDFTRSLITELHVSGGIYTLNGAMDIMKTYDIWVDISIVTGSMTTFKGNNICFKNICKHNCNIVIMLTDLFDNKEIFLMEAQILMQRICIHSRFNLTILASAEDSVFLLGFRTFHSSSTQNEQVFASIEPTLLGKCDEDTTTMRWISRNYTDEMKISCNGCIINAAMFDEFPYTLLVNNTGHLRFGGIEGSMIEEIARRIKAGLNREVIVWTNETTIEDELYSRLYSTSRNDIVFGGLLWDPELEIDYTISYGMVHITWMVPIKSYVSLRGLITPFRASVWYAIICVLIIGGLAKLLFIRDISFLDIAALVIGVPVFQQPLRISSRIQFISWSLFGFFLTQFYLGSLADQLTNASNLQIESMEELLSSGLKMGGTERFATLLETFDDKDEHEIFGKTIRENLIVFEEDAYINQFLDIVGGRNTSLALMIMLNITDTHRVSNLGYAHIIKETMANYPLALATWQGLPYLSDINSKIQIFVQAGMIEYWSNVVKKQIYYEMEDEDDPSNLDLEELAPAFLLLIIGYFCGCCLLVMEIIFYPSRIFL